MISTKSLISEISDIPRAWVFENYLKLDEKLSGQDVRIKSVFTPADKTPSMYVFYAKYAGSYRFKDFSTGKSGDGVTLVTQLFNLSSRGEAAHKIMTDYNQFILNNKEDFSLREFKIQSKYKVVDFKTRMWTNLDSRYWTQYHIGSRLLEQHYVLPLESYTMEKEIDSVVEKLIITGSHYIYGYFRTDGTLYKIYQPYTNTNKFIKIKDYIQGTDQLQYKFPYLVITASLKDLMFLKRLNFDLETVAPDSENSLIPESVINSYKLKYKSICTLFDNDVAGIDATQKYALKYNLPGIYLPMSKDLSDSGKDFGIAKVREVLTPLLKQVLKNV